VTLGAPRPAIAVRPVEAEDRSWAEAFLREVGALRVARRGELVAPLDHPMLVCEVEGVPEGLLTYVIDRSDCEILTIHARRRRNGVGTALIEAVRAVARERGCQRLWLVTTNDNVDAMRFYQRLGFRLSAIRSGAGDAARRSLKPEIPEIGDHGIPLRDEIDLEGEL
jgi:GNAT superfamily N-acetyltransferase